MLLETFTTCSLRDDAGMKSFTNTIGLVRFSCCETMQREGCRVSTQLDRKICFVRKMICSVSPPVQSSDCIQFYVLFTSRYSSQAPLGHSYPSLSPAAVSLRREGNTEMLALDMHCVAAKHIHSLVPRGGSGYETSTFIKPLICSRQNLVFTMHSERFIRGEPVF